MSTIEEDQETLRSRIVPIVFILLSVGLISFGILGVVTQHSFFVNTASYRVDYYKGQQAVGQGIIDISFGIASLAGLFWLLRHRASSQKQYQANQLIAYILTLIFIVTLISGTFIYFKII